MRETTAVDIANKVYNETNIEGLEYGTDNFNTFEFRLNDYVLMCQGEYDDEGQPDGYTYSVYWREEGHPHYSEHVTTDGDTTLDTLEDVLVEWLEDNS